MITPVAARLPDPPKRAADLQAVCSAAVKFAGVDHSALVLFDKGGTIGTVVAEFPSNLPTAVGHVIRVEGVRSEEQLVRERTPIIVNDVEGAVDLGPVHSLLVSLGIKSFLVVPIVCDGAVRGSLSFDALKEPRQFTAVDEMNCLQFAEFAAQVVANLDLIDSLEAVHDASVGIVSETEHPVLLTTIVSSAVRSVQGLGGGIYELEPQGDALRVVASIPPDLVGTRLVKGEGGAAWATLLEKDPVVSIPSYRQFPARARRYGDGSRFGSVLAVALGRAGAETGVLWVDASDGRPFRPSEISAIQRLAAIASIAIAQSRQRDLSQERVRRLNSLTEATTEIARLTSTGDRAARLSLIAKLAHKTVGAQGCGILLVEQEGSLTWVANHDDLIDRFEAGHQFEIISGPRSGLTGHLAFEKRPFRACGRELLSHFAVAKPDDPSAPSCHSLLAIPLLEEGGRLCGLLRISNKLGPDGRPGPGVCFSEDDQAIAESFGQAALAQIGTADLLDEIKRGEQLVRVLLEACSVIAKTKSANEGLAELAAIVVRRLDKSFCRILLKGEHGDSLTVVAAAKRLCEDEFQWRPRRGEDTRTNAWAALDSTLASGEPLLLSGESHAINLKELSRWLCLASASGEPRELQSLLWVPIKTGSTIVGLMSVGELRQTSRSPFTDQQVRDAVAISSTVSVLIERIQRDKRFIERSFRIESAIALSTSLQESLPLIAQQAHHVASAAGGTEVVGSVWMRDGDGLICTGMCPVPEPPLPGRVQLPVVAESTHQLRVVADCILTGSVQQVDAVSVGRAELDAKRPTAQLAVPILINGGAACGAISVEYLGASCCDKDDVDLLQGLANQAALAIARDEGARENTKTRTIALIGAAASIWTHSLQTVGQQIMIEINDILECVKEPQPVVRALGRVKRLACDMEFPFSGPLGRQEGVSLLDINQFLLTSADRLRDRAKALAGTVEITHELAASVGLQLGINDQWLRHALNVFLENALEAVRSSPKREIHIYTEVGEGECRILVRNTGNLVPGDTWTKLGNEKILAQARGDEHGVGVLIADLIVSVYGGRIAKVSNELDNIVMGIALPVGPGTGTHRNSARRTQ